ncbi:hypothetical protein BX667DRAFT_508325 [Coemansia mojavensis]|nr:hypothetical protein BX667DRAFT_508325 [Coemansia mojavensis]
MGTHNLRLTMNLRERVSSSCRSMAKEVVVSVGLVALLLLDEHPVDFKTALTVIPIPPSAHCAIVDLHTKYDLNNKPSDGDGYGSGDELFPDPHFDELPDRQL